jgi:hypothetical protein
MINSIKSFYSRIVNRGIRPKVDLEEFVDKEVIVVYESGVEIETIVLRTETVPVFYYLARTFTSHTREGYWFASGRRHPYNIKSVKLNEIKSTIDLEQFIGTEVLVTFENGTVKKGFIERTDGPHWNYGLRCPDGFFTTYTKTGRNGYYWPTRTNHFLHIKSIVPMPAE